MRCYCSTVRDKQSTKINSSGLDNIGIRDKLKDHPVILSVSSEESETGGDKEHKEARRPTG